jgi:hypothetical protein
MMGHPEMITTRRKTNADDIFRFARLLMCATNKMKSVKRAA